ncbi:GNAT family N-acetyltransferase [Paucibacter sp. JuS9]|uniref:GNAT family N-acetyltransferase n=1 Tax=Paucibacter sp. JuS9 TaxID=3228748 RepID=UPI003757B9FE
MGTNCARPPMRIAIAPAASDEAPIVSGLLMEAAEWLRVCGHEMWLSHEVSVERVAPDVEMGSFLVARMGMIPVGVVKYQTSDELFWPDVASNSSSFIHRLAVARSWSGRGISTALIDYAADLARRDGREWLRLDCSSERAQLRNFYERVGFRHCGFRQVNEWHVALYERPTIPLIADVRGGHSSGRPCRSEKRSAT